MSHDAHQKPQVRLNEEKYNPYDDKSLHSTMEPPNFTQEEIEPLNSVLKHGDIIAGYQVPKKLDQLPKKIRPIVKWYRIVQVGLLIGVLLGTFIYTLLRLFIR